MYVCKFPNLEIAWIGVQDALPQIGLSDLGSTSLEKKDLPSGLAEYCRRNKKRAKDPGVVFGPDAWIISLPGQGLCKTFDIGILWQEIITEECYEVVIFRVHYSGRINWNYGERKLETRIPEYIWEKCIQWIGCEANCPYVLAAREIMELHR